MSAAVAVITEDQLRELITEAVARATPTPSSPWKTAEQLAQYLGVSVATVNRRAAEGMPWVRMHAGGRRMFHTGDVDEWLRSMLRAGTLPVDRKAPPRRSNVRGHGHREVPR